MKVTVGEDKEDRLTKKTNGGEEWWKIGCRKWKASVEGKEVGVIKDIKVWVRKGELFLMEWYKICNTREV